MSARVVVEGVEHMRECGDKGGQEEEVGIIRVMASSRNLEGALEVVKNMRAQGREPSRQVGV